MLHFASPAQISDITLAPLPLWQMRALGLTMGLRPMAALVAEMVLPASHCLNTMSLQHRGRHRSHLLLTS